MPDHGRGRVHRFRDHVVSGVNWRPTRFVDEVRSSRVCGLCRMIPKRTVVLPCGHALCESCHAANLEGGVGQCPLDQVQFEEAECFGYDLPTRIANTLKVYCWNEAHGCEYTGTVDRMLEHYENDCTFHTVECVRCGEAVQHRDLPTHYAAGCSAGVSTAITESSQPTAVTLEDLNASLEHVKAMLGCLNHDQLLPVIQTKMNELTERARYQEASFAELTREVRACEQNLKAEMEQITATTSSTVSHQLTSQQNPLEEVSTSTSLSLHTGQDLILRKLERLGHLENWRKTSPEPDCGRVIVRCEAFYGRLSHLTSALSTSAQVKGERVVNYVLTVENCEEIIQWQGERKKFGENTNWLTMDTYFTTAVWKNGTSTLSLEIEFNGALADSQCWPPFWRVSAEHPATSKKRWLTPGAKHCYCKRLDPSLPHFHLKFTADIASMENDGYLRDGKMAFLIWLSSKETEGSIRRAP
ncbi:uncharacterized protein [Dermacentor albipictus]|uniref:uncharacterized protein n=1 Tax=Dermacentor albipictus TaxID=60249 RepID=UPI0038FC8E74